MVVLSPLQVLSHLPFYSLSHCLNILRWFYPVAWALGYWTRSHPVIYLLAAKLAHISCRPHSPLLQGRRGPFSPGLQTFPSPGKPSARLGRLTDSKVSLYWSGGRMICLQGQINIYKYILHHWKGCIAVNREMSSDLKVVCLCLGWCHIYVQHHLDHRTVIIRFSYYIYYIYIICMYYI